MNLDRVCQVERLTVDEETIITEFNLCPGGSAANTIYGLAKLGIKTGFIGAIGDDTDGRMLINALQEAKADTGRIRVKEEAQTGSALCLSDKAGKRAIYVFPGANSFLSIDDVDISYVNQAKILHISSFVEDKQFAMILKLIKKLKPSVKLSFAPGALYAAKGLKALSPILKRTSILFVNSSELKQITGEDMKKGTRICLELGCQMVAVTLGKGTQYRGRTTTSYIRDKNKKYVVAAVKQGAVKVVDTTGAGDAFCAGFLYGLFRGKDPEKSGRIGDIVAKFCISEVGARDGLPTLKKLAERYRKLYGEKM